MELRRIGYQLNALSTVVLDPGSRWIELLYTEYLHLHCLGGDKVPMYSLWCPDPLITIKTVVNLLEIQSPLRYWYRYV